MSKPTYDAVDTDATGMGTALQAAETGQGPALQAAGFSRHLEKMPPVMPPAYYCGNAVANVLLACGFAPEVAHDAATLAEGAVRARLLGVEPVRPVGSGPEIVSAGRRLGAPVLRLSPEHAQLLERIEGDDGSIDAEQLLAFVETLETVVPLRGAPHRLVQQLPHHGPLPGPSGTLGCDDDLGYEPQTAEAKLCTCCVGTMDLPHDADCPLCEDDEDTGGNARATEAEETGHGPALPDEHGEPMDMATRDALSVGWGQN